MINGLINVYKEPGFTSFDVVAVMRGITGQKKIGHTGTLDPMAEGVLPICLGNATKLADMLKDKKKEYIATFKLGERTDTLDITGEILERRKVSAKASDIFEAVKSFEGGYDQLPPMYSAKWVDGKRLYDLARKGIEIERNPVFVSIYEIEVLKLEIPFVTIRVLCSKGTYIRSLCEDIAKKIGEISVMTSLKRTRVSNFTAETSHKLSELSELKKAGLLTKTVIPTDFAFEEYPVFTVKKEFRKAIDNGNKLRYTEVEPEFNLSKGQIVRIYNDENRFTGLYEAVFNEENLKPYKMFLEN